MVLRVGVVAFCFLQYWTLAPHYLKIIECALLLTHSCQPSLEHMYLAKTLEGSLVSSSLVWEKSRAKILDLANSYLYLPIACNRVYIQYSSIPGDRYFIWHNS